MGVGEIINMIGRYSYRVSIFSELFLRAHVSTGGHRRQQRCTDPSWLRQTKVKPALSGQRPINLNRRWDDLARFVELVVRPVGPSVHVAGQVAQVLATELQVLRPHSGNIPIALLELGRDEPTL